jgi:Zn-dependent alcohol dehydrogenase
MKTRAAVLRAVTAQRPYTESRPMVVEDVELSAPRPGELLVRMEAAGVCHSDLSVVDGSRIRPLPMALGHEAVGVVEEAGAGVADVKAGDHVVLAFVPSCGHCPECSAGRPALCAPGAAARPCSKTARAGRCSTISASPASPATRSSRANPPS